MHPGQWALWSAAPGAAFRWPPPCRTSCALKPTRRIRASALQRQTGRAGIRSLPHRVFWRERRTYGTIGTLSRGTAGPGISPSQSPPPPPASSRRSHPTRRLHPRGRPRRRPAGGTGAGRPTRHPGEALAHTHARPDVVERLPVSVSWRTALGRLLPGDTGGRAAAQAVR
jgi:hypothetical protein